MEEDDLSQLVRVMLHGFTVMLHSSHDQLPERMCDTITRGPVLQFLQVFSPPLSEIFWRDKRLPDREIHHDDGCGIPSKGRGLRGAFSCLVSTPTPLPFESLGRGGEPEHIPVSLGMQCKCPS